MSEADVVSDDSLAHYHYRQGSDPTSQRQERSSEVDHPSRCPLWVPLAMICCGRKALTQSFISCRRNKDPSFGFCRGTSATASFSSIATELTFASTVTGTYRLSVLPRRDQSAISSIYTRPRRLSSGTRTFWIASSWFERSCPHARSYNLLSPSSLFPPTDGTQ